MSRLQVHQCSCTFPRRARTAAAHQARPPSRRLGPLHGHRSHLVRAFEQAPKPKQEAKPKQDVKSKPTSTQAGAVVVVDGCSMLLRLGLLSQLPKLSAGRICRDNAFLND